MVLLRSIGPGAERWRVPTRRQSPISSPKLTLASDSWDLIEGLLFGLEEAMEVVGPGGVPQFAVQPLNCLPASAPGTLKSGEPFHFPRRGRLMASG